MVQKGVDLRRHIAMSQKDFPSATGEFSQLLGQIALAAKIVSRELNRSGLGELIGLSEGVNIYGEPQARMDVFANRIFTRALLHNGGICVVGTEEEEDPIPVRDPDRRGKYVVTLDPLDGSSNIDYNVTVGTIFGVHRRLDPEEDSPGKEKDLLQPGTNLVASGYVVYGCSTMLVYTTGRRVFGFTLDRSIGEFLLSHPDIRVSDTGGFYSLNGSYYGRWSRPVQRLVDEMRGDPEITDRYTGSLVADVHRNLLGGGVFLYPAEPETPGKEQGKLRLLFEAAPLAHLIEQAGGRATNGREDIVDIVPRWLHQRTPLFLGSSRWVNRLRELMEESSTPESEADGS